MKKTIIFLALSTLLFVACEDRSDLTAPSLPNTGDAEFSRFVTIGNSLTAGYQSGSLYESSQVYSLGKIIADQVGANFEQPIISEPGIPGKLELHDLKPTILPNSQMGEPTNLNYAAPYNNLGVPGAILYDLIDETDLTTKYASRQNPYFQIVLRNQAAFGASIIKQALVLQPTFVNLWIGNNDVLGYATSGGTKGTDAATGTLPTDVPTFTFLYNQVATALTDTSGYRKIAVANIPDVQNIPFFTTVGPKLASSLTAMGVPAMVYQTHSSPGYGVATTSDLETGKVLLTLTGSAATAYLGDRSGAFYSATGIPVPAGVVTDSAFGFSPYNPWPDMFTLDPTEIVIAQTATSGFNNVIGSTVAANPSSWVLIDVNLYFDDIADGGLVLDGINFTTSFILGNTFSLDGVHPTTRGYAVLANKFISEINNKFNASIPPVSVSSYPASIDLYN